MRQAAIGSWRKEEQAKKSLRTGEGTTISSTGASGCILTLWDLQTWKEEITLCVNHWILTVLKHKDTNSKISL
jgi:hypothetical protein